VQLHVLWSAKSGNSPYKIKANEKVCLQLSYRQKEITTCEMIKRNIIQMGAYTVLTRGQMTASREMTK
jgi:hypothetical protein